MTDSTPGDPFADPVSAQADLAVGDRILQRFRVLNVIFGGMGTVYRVRDEVEDYILALKTLQSRFAEDDVFVQRFRDEATTWIQLGEHRNVVRAKFIQPVRGSCGIFLEFVDGTTLTPWTQGRHPLTVESCIHLAIQFCDGMVHAANALPGIVHRDIKPENVLVAVDGTLKITDWGLSTTLQHLDSQLIGTPGYISPEQIEDPRSIDVRSDIFAFGLVLHQLLTGANPLQAQRDNPNADAQPDISLPDNISGPLSGLVRDCLQHDRSRRPPNFEAIRSALLQLDLERYETEVSRSADWTYMQWNNKAASLIELCRFEEALAASDEAVRLGPNAPSVWLNRGILMERRQQPEQALKCYDKAVAFNPHDRLAWNNRGNALRTLDKLDEALASYDQSLYLQGDYAMALNNKGWLLYESMNDAAGAFDCYRAAIDADSFYAEPWNNLGLLQRQLGDVSGAEDSFSSALAINPRFPGPYTNQAGLECDGGNYDKAIELCDVALRLDPGNHAAMNNKGVALLAMERIEKALICFQASLEVFNGYEPALVNAAGCFRRLDRPQDSLELLDSQPGLACNRQSASAERGRTLYDLGRYSEAVGAFEAALQAGAQDLHFNLGTALIRLGRHADAAVVLGEAVDRGIDADDCLLNLGVCQHHIGEHDAAIATYERILIKDPGHVMAMNNIGLVLSKKGADKQAVAKFQAAIEADPTYAQGFFNLGSALARTAEPYQAEVALRCCLQLDSEHAAATAELGALLITQDRIAEGMTNLSQAISTDSADAASASNLRVAEAIISDSSHWDAWQAGLEQPLSVPPDAMALGPDANSFALSYENQCHLINLTTQKLSSFDLPRSDNRQMAYFPNADLWLGLGDELVCVLHLPTGGLTQLGAGTRPKGVCAGPRGRFAMVFARHIVLMQWLDGQVAETGQIDARWAGVNHTAFSEDGSRVAICQGDHVAEFDVVSGTMLGVLGSPAGIVYEPRYTRDGCALAALHSGSAGVSMCRWDTSSGWPASADVVSISDNLASLKLSPHAESWAGFEQGGATLCIGNAITGGVLNIPVGNGRLIGFSPSGRHIATVDTQPLLKTWRMLRAGRYPGLEPN